MDGSVRRLIVTKIKKEKTPPKEFLNIIIYRVWRGGCGGQKGRTQPITMENNYVIAPTG